MIHLINKLCYHFARSRQRKGVPIPKILKDLSQNQQITLQIKELRNKFEETTPSHTFTEVMKARRRVKLGHHFQINNVEIHKKLKKVYNKKMQVSQLEAYSGDDFDYLMGDKSYLYDQEAEIEFEKKFKHELFVKKETNRLINKEKENYKNYLQGQQNEKYLQYEKNKMMFKDQRIESMMNYEGNNQQLQLLIESGIIDHPENLSNIINSMENSEKMLIAESSSNCENEASIIEVHNKHQNMLGMKELHDNDKLQQFLEQHSEMNKQDQERTNNSAKLLREIKLYEKELFMERYEALNFRFKGRTKFAHMKESEMLSYIKTENIEPINLLLIYKQNKAKLSNFGLPIMTPAVMARIYAKSSTYEFPETENNNRFVMLKDNLFVELERDLFMVLDRIYDEMFCDAVWAYSINHEHEQGVLNPRRCQAIHGAIMTQIEERVPYLWEDDLGLLCRAILKLNLIKIIPIEKWQCVVDVLNQRLRELEDKYEFESVITLLSLLPVSQSSIEAVAQHIDIYRTYKWQYKETLESFLKCAAILIRFKHKIPMHIGSKKIMLSLRGTISKKVIELIEIIPKVNINNISKLLTVVQKLESLGGTSHRIPIKLVNLSKKVIVDSIRMQKNMLHRHTLSRLSMSMALLDYQYCELNPLYKEECASLIRELSFKQFLPIRVHPFNSINYFIYHEMARLAEIETDNLSVSALSSTFLGLSIAQYKNEALYDSILNKIIYKIRNESYKLHLKSLSVVLVCYCLQRRTHGLLQDIVLAICKYKEMLPAYLHATLMVQLISAVCNVYVWGQTTDILVVNMFLHLHHVLEPYINHMYEEELVTLLFCYTLIYSKYVNMHQELLSGPKETLLLHIINNLQQKTELKPLSAEQRYVVGLCKVVLKTHDKQTILEKQSVVMPEEVLKLEQIFQLQYIDSITKHEANIGCPHPYSYIYNEIALKLGKKHGSSALTLLPWRIEVPSENLVYFISTYEHLMVRMNNEKQIVTLYGFWKLYSEIYSKQHFELLCSFLEN